MTLTLLDALGGQGFHGWADLYPPIDIREAIRHYLIEIDLHDVAADDVEVEVMGSRLHIRFERHSEHTEDEPGMHRTERTYGSFERVIGLPPDVDGEGVTAGMEDGKLHISVPKLDVPVRRVNITGGSSSQDG